MNLKIVIFGLSITSSWGNGHAATYRALVKALHQRGHQLTFIERDVPWYRDNRDLETADYCRIELYQDLREVPRRFGSLLADAELVILGSYVPEGTILADWITSRARGVTAFYDIDTPVTLSGLKTGETSYISAALIPRFDLYLSFTGGPTLSLIEDEYASPRARVLHCAADIDAVSPADPHCRWMLGYLGTYSADRQPALERLLFEASHQLPQERFVVAGCQYPVDVAWPPNVGLIEHLPQTRHAEFYQSQRYTLNITREDMRSAGFSPSVRLFEAAAFGVPIISDKWRGLDSLFTPGREILVVESAQDLVQLLRQLPEERRREIAVAAHQRLLRNHTPEHRARQLESYYQEAIAARRIAARAGVAARAEVVARTSAIDSICDAKPKTPGRQRNGAWRAKAQSRLSIVVTGGAGFIGSHLCDRLVRRGDRVICVDNLYTGTLDNIRPLQHHPRFRFIKHDVRDPLDISEPVHEIYNLACAASPRHYQRDPVGTLQTCVMGVFNVLDFARRKSARVLQASTSEVYGDPQLHPQTEDYVGHVNPVGPRACYDEGKRAAETLSFDYCRIHGVPIKISRIFNTYGPRMLENDGRVISNFVVQALRNEPLTIYGNGEQTRSFCYIDDLIFGLELLMATGDHVTGPCNLGNPHEVTIAQIADFIVELTGSTSPIAYKPLPQDDPKRRRPAIERAVRLLGWRPRVSLEHGLKATIGYFTLKLLGQESPSIAPISSHPMRWERKRSKPLTNARSGLVTLMPSQE